MSPAGGNVQQDHLEQRSRIIGKTALDHEKCSVLGSLVGAYIISLLRNGCVLYDIPNPVQEIVTGVIIVAAVSIDQLLVRRRN